MRKLKQTINKFTGKNAYRMIAGALVVTLLGGSMGMVAAYAEDNKSDEKTISVSSKNGDDGLLSGLGSVSISDGDFGKEENVYLFCDASGNVYSTLVANHLKNSDGSATITDYSVLKDIVNVKGDETYMSDKNKLIWHADGNDIYYQGTTSEEAPVSQSVTYYLDGKKISPDELAGKSGEVTIRFDFTNNSSYTEEIDGEKYTVCVPFAAFSVLMLDDNFTNVSVENGRISAGGDSTIIMGYAFPGINDSLKLSEDEGLPSYFEVTADVKDFSLDAAMTFVVNAGSLLETEDGDLSSLDEKINELSDASAQLREGSGELVDGIDTLLDGLRDYADGVQQLYDASGELGSAIGLLADSAQSVSDGLAALDAALHIPMGDTEKSAAEAAAAAAVEEEFASGTRDAVAGQIYSALRYAQDENGNVTDGMLYTALYGAVYSAYPMLDAAQISASVESSLNDIASQLADACEQVAVQAAQSAAVAGAESAKLSIAQQIEALQDNGYSLVSGAAALSGGMDELLGQIPALVDGITALNDASGELIDGGEDLSDGGHELSDGMSEFDEEGISEISDAYWDDIRPMANRLTALIDAGQAYQTFSGLADGMTGTVRFIYKLDAIK